MRRGQLFDLGHELRHTGSQRFRQDVCVGIRGALRGAGGTIIARRKEQRKAAMRRETNPWRRLRCLVQWPHMRLVRIRGRVGQVGCARRRRAFIGRVCPVFEPHLQAAHPVSCVAPSGVLFWCASPLNPPLRAMRKIGAEKAWLMKTSHTPPVLRPRRRRFCHAPGIPAFTPRAGSRNSWPPGPRRVQWCTSRKPASPPRAAPGGSVDACRRPAAPHRNLRAREREVRAMCHAHHLPPHFCARGTWSRECLPGPWRESRTEQSPPRPFAS